MHAGSQAAASKTEPAAPRGVKTRHTDIVTGTITDRDIGVTRRETPHRHTAGENDSASANRDHRAFEVKKPRPIDPRRASNSGNASAMDVFKDELAHILFLNIQGFTSHSAELTATILSLGTKPLLICFNETF